MSAPSRALVTVVIATYNMSRYLAGAVRSVLEQTISEVEVLVIDDGSRDRTRSVMQQFADEARLHYAYQENAGQARAKNAGICKATGQFVGFLDADDEWLPRKLELELPLFERAPAVGVVYSDFERMDADGRPLPAARTPMHRGQVSPQLLAENFVCFPTALVRRELLLAVGGLDEQFPMGIDYDLWLRLSVRCEFDFVELPTVRYRVWPGQMSKNYRKRYECGIEIMQRFLRDHPTAVSRADVIAAWARTYTGRGNVLLWHEQDFRSAVADFARALSYKPTFWPAWRSLLRMCLTTKAPRWSDAAPADRRLTRGRLNRGLQRLTETVGIYRFAKRFTAGTPRILFYHSLLGDGASVAEATATLTWHLQLLKRDFQIVPLRTIFDAVRRGERLVPGLVALTFDDGYQNFFGIAMPLLRRFDAPATIFLPTDFIDRKSWLWPDRVRYVLQKTPHARIEAGVAGLQSSVVIDSADSREAAWCAVADHCARLTVKLREAAIAELAASLAVSIPAEAPAGFEPLTWDQVRAMARCGIEIGSHSCSHARLSGETLESQRREITESKRRIEEMTQRPVRYFCYPYGLSGDYTDATKRLVADSGYEGAVAAYWTPKLTRDPYELGRWPAPSDSREFKKVVYGVRLLTWRAKCRT